VTLHGACYDPRDSFAALLPEGTLFPEETPWIASAAIFSPPPPPR
jgi:hypothetical protein